MCCIMCMVKKVKSYLQNVILDNKESLCIKVFFEVYLLSCKLFTFTIETLFQLRTS